MEGPMTSTIYGQGAGVEDRILVNRGAAHPSLRFAEGGTRDHADLYSAALRMFMHSQAFGVFQLYWDIRQPPLAFLIADQGPCCTGPSSFI